MKSEQNPNIAAIKPSSIQSMFNTIAPTYDLLNRLMSFGMDIRWRKKAVSFLHDKENGIILDIAAGSGDVAFELLDIKPRFIVATDFALNMLNVFQNKLNTRGNSDTIKFVSCDALYLPFQDEIFDATIVAFGIRNFANRLLSLQEMLRVLKPKGISIILELTKPENRVVSQIYNVYTKAILPALGKIISRHNSAYNYLPQSITHFPNQKEFLSLMTEAGFAETKAHRLTFGTATIYFGKKPKR